MKPKKQEKKTQYELLETRLERLVNPRHPLAVMAKQIDWSAFDEEFGKLYSEKGRPGIPTRVMVGLHYLKHTFNESDESVVERFVENPYWQYFCGFEYFQHRFPIDPSTMTRWRNRIGSEGMKKLLAETFEMAKRRGDAKPHHFEKVNVDTTVQEKAIAFPTDARLYQKARIRLVKEAKKRSIPLRQNYVRKGQAALRKQGRDDPPSRKAAMAWQAEPPICSSPPTSCSKRSPPWYPHPGSTWCATTVCSVRTPRTETRSFRPAGGPKRKANTRPSKKYRLAWSALLALVFQIDVVCECGGHMTIVAAVTGPDSAGRYLEGVGVTFHAQ